MPFVTHRNQRIHYTVMGAGPLVVLQHGLLWDAGSWVQGGFVEALSACFRVACVDSLGHGLSDKPADAALYGQAQRAGDLVAVMDDLDYARAHVVGYSMGGWVAVGMARHYPERLSSLVVGGWDIVDGLPPGPTGPLKFDQFMGYVRRVAPQEAAWVSPEFEAGVRACFDALSERDGAAEAVREVKVPVLIWTGQDDPYHALMQAFAQAAGLPFLSTPGGHASAVLQPDAQTLEQLRAFFEAAPSTDPR